jgi:hypothetical protein
MQNTNQYNGLINFNEQIIELHNLARTLELNILTKVVSAKLRALADELSELNRPPSLGRSSNDVIHPDIEQ